MKDLTGGYALGGLSFLELNLLTNETHTGGIGSFKERMFLMEQHLSFYVVTHYTSYSLPHL